MSHLREFSELLLYIFSFLALASLISFVLRLKLSPNRDNPVIENLVTRINSWWLMVIILGLSIASGKIGIIILFFLLSFGALREFLSLTRKRRADHNSLLLAFFFLLPAQYVLIFMEWYGLFAIFLPVYGFFLLSFVAATGGDSENYLSRVAETQWAIMITIYGVSYGAAILLLDLPGFEGKQLLLAAFLIIVTQSSDVLQYIWGKLLGKTKLAPKLSPSKTWEGLIGGWISATIIGTLLYWITPFSIFEAAIMSIILCITGFGGGLVLSAIKRDKGVKDWGQMIAGHGGFIDRLDSVVFSAPIFFHIVRYFWS